MSVAAKLPAWVPPKIRALLLDFETYEGAEIVVIPKTQAVRIWPCASRHITSWCRALKARKVRVRLGSSIDQTCYLLEPPEPPKTQR